uniref:Uncharacterized protein n=1 Tax=Stegastes partitus TaxID=144197 RepID=A0A3B4ZG99_9TELE
MHLNNHSDISAVGTVLSLIVLNFFSPSTEIVRTSVLHQSSLKFTTRHLGESEVSWKTVLWFDEEYCDCKTWGGRIMAWRWFSTAGPGKEILEHDLMQSARELGRRFVLHQDDDLKQTAKMNAVDCTFKTGSEY